MPTQPDYDAAEDEAMDALDEAIEAAWPGINDDGSCRHGVRYDLCPTCSPPECRVCARPIKRPPSPRAGDRLRYCGLRCSGIAKRRVPEDEVLRIITARSLRIEWSAIAAEVGCSISTVQRALRRAQAPVRLPRWVERENLARRDVLSATNRNASP